MRDDAWLHALRKVVFSTSIWVCSSSKSFILFWSGLRWISTLTPRLLGESVASPLVRCVFVEAPGARTLCRPFCVLSSGLRAESGTTELRAVEEPALDPEPPSFRKLWRTLTGACVRDVNAPEDKECLKLSRSLAPLLDTAAGGDRTSPTWCLDGVDGCELKDCLVVAPAVREGAANVLPRGCVSPSLAFEIDERRTEGTLLATGRVAGVAIELVLRLPR